MEEEHEEPIIKKIMDINGKRKELKEKFEKEDRDLRELEFSLLARL